MTWWVATEYESRLLKKTLWATATSLNEQVWVAHKPFASSKAWCYCLAAVAYAGVVQDSPPALPYVTAFNVKASDFNAENLRADDLRTKVLFTESDT